MTAPGSTVVVESMKQCFGRHRKKNDSSVYSVTWMCVGPFVQPAGSCAGMLMVTGPLIRAAMGGWHLLPQRVCVLPGVANALLSLGFSVLGSFLFWRCGGFLCFCVLGFSLLL